MNRRRMAPKYNPLDDVPHSVRQNLTQPSPCYSIVTDSGSPDGPPHSHPKPLNPSPTPPQVYRKSLPASCGEPWCLEEKGVT